MGACVATREGPYEANGLAPSGADVDLLRALADRIDQRDPGAFNNLGVLYFSKGLHADAVNAFVSALNLDGRMRTAARNLEVAAAKPGACDDRIAVLDARLAGHANDIGARRDRARLLRLIGRLDDSRRELDAMIAENPDDAVALFERGQIEVRAGDLRRAQRWFERAVNANERDPMPRLHLAEVLYQRGQNEQALDVLNALIVTDETIADAHLLRGFVLGDIGQHELAVEATERANVLNPSLQLLEPHLSLDTAAVLPTGNAQLQPETTLPRYGLGLAFRQRGYFDQARQEFLRSIESGEEARMARHAMGELDILEGAYGDAQRIYQLLLDEFPDHPRYWNEYGVALHQGGALVEAATAYRNALRHDPRFALAYNNLGVALADIGDMLAAREAFIRSTELNASQLAAPLNLARWYQQQNDYLAALTVVREVVDFHVRDASGWYELGMVLTKLDQVLEARGAFAAAIERHPDHAEARYEFASALNALGDTDGAVRETERALALCPVRIAPRMKISIDVQHECPDACGAINLLSLHSDAPLAGVTFAAHDVLSMLPEHASTPATVILDVVADAAVTCALADRYAARGVHGEAVDRYASARVLLEPDHAATGTPAYNVWRRAAVGEARSMCLLGRGGEVMPLLKTVGRHNKNDAEVLTLFARAAVALSTKAGDAMADAARIAVLRVLRLEPSSAALMHFTGDVALDIRDDELALACYRRALALDPTRPSPRVAIARVLRSRGDLLAARLELAAALSVAPAWRDAVLELVSVHHDSDRPLEALAVVTAYLDRETSDCDAMVLLAEVLLRLNRDADARVAVLRILRFDAQHPSALWLDGLLLSRQYRMRDAMDRWRRVAAQDRDLTRARQAQEAIAVTDAPSLRLVS